MLGFLVGAVGLGGLTGALYLVRRARVRGLGGVIRVGSTLLGAALLTLALAGSGLLALAACLVAGFGMMVIKASANTILQTIVEDDKRGRVMSLYTMAFIGTVPIGSLCAGAIASQLGAPLTVAIGGAATLGVAALFERALPSFRKQVRPLYTRLGIPPLPGIPEIGDPRIP